MVLPAITNSLSGELSQQEKELIDEITPLVILICTLGFFIFIISFINRTGPDWLYIIPIENVYGILGGIYLLLGGLTALLISTVALGSKVVE
jgi:hypothetical protein